MRPTRRPRLGNLLGASLVYRRPLFERNAVRSGGWPKKRKGYFIKHGVVDDGGAAGWVFQKGCDDSCGDAKKGIVQHYFGFLKRGGTAPFNAGNLPKQFSTEDRIVDHGPS